MNSSIEKPWQSLVYLISPNGKYSALVDALLGYGYRVEISSGLPTDLQNKASPTLVLLELSDVTIDAVRQHFCHPALPVIALLTQDSSELKVQALDQGADRYMVYPRDIHKLEQILGVLPQARLDSSLYGFEHRALNHHAIVSVTDHKGIITYANEKFCAISGYNEDELLGQSHRLLKSNHHKPEFFTDMWHTISTGGVWSGTICNRAKNGGLYWVESTITPFLNRQNKPFQYLAIRTDISEVKKQQLATRAIAESISSLWDENYFIKKAKTLVAAFDVSAAFIAQCDSDGAHYSTLALFERGQNQAAETINIPQETFQSLASAGFCLVSKNAADHFKDDNWFKANAFNAYCGVPLFSSYGDRLGIVGILQKNQDLDTPWIQSILKIVAATLGAKMERSQSELALKKSEERLRRGQIYANLGTWDWNIVTGDLFWTERIAPLFGYPLGELETSYDNFLAAVHPLDREKLNQAVNDCVQHDKPYEIEHRVIWPDGTVRWLQERGAVIRNANGEALQMLGVVQDIHDRKMAEISLAEREIQLREAQSLANLGNWRLEVTSGEMIWSDEVYRIFGLNPEAFEPDAKSLHMLVHSEDREQVNDAFYPQGNIPFRDVEYRIVRPDGTIRYVHELAQTVHSCNGEVEALIGTLQDITIQKLSEQEVLNARDEAQRANNAKSEFLSSMSHELRTPMNAILGFGQLLECDRSLTEDQAENVTEIITAANHLLLLINEVLDFSKIEAGGLSLDIEPVHLGNVIAECISLSASHAERSGIRLLDNSSNDIWVQADRVRLKQVLLNLVSNAIKYNHQGGEVVITTGLSNHGNGLISVTDTGLGLSAEQQRELFIPFNRLGAENSAIEGTGIGLSISKRIVDLMQAKMTVDSTPGKGSTFTIELPITESNESAEQVLSPWLKQENSQQETSQQEIFQAEQSSIDFPASKVLYIEDNPANLKLVAHIIGRKKNIELISAHNAELGIELANSRHPNLILLDINLPGMDGYSVNRHIKSEKATQDIPVIAVTANAMEQDILRGKQEGFADYITKPINVNAFNALLDEYLLERESDL